MNVRELIQLLERFDPEAQVRLCVSMPGRVIETHEQLWVGDYGGGPQITTARDFKQFYVYVGCGLDQFVGEVPEPKTDLGQYEDPEIAAKVHDFYVVHQKLHQPLAFPDFDYENWIPPRTVSGEYNPLIAKILRDKLLRE
jgi:hypothetical protein